ncbi:MAG: LysR family transcriptional regulator [Rhodospirillales bacterium]|nr:LysR family transcriptional regulator [Rhodospirillales bacterium]
MTLEQLRIFVAVAEREHVTQAAHHLNLTQSATSAAVSALEHRYQAKLFDRVGRRIALTAAGRLFLSEARAVLVRAASAETVLADLAGLRRGTLALTASQTVANYWLPPLMHRFRARHGGISMTLRIGNTESVTSWVHEGLVDAGFIEGAINDPALDCEPVADDELALVVSPEHAWTREPPASERDFAKTRWVLREPGSGTRAIAEEVLASRGVSLSAADIALELPSNEAVRSAVEAGAGATVISQLVVAGSLKAMSLARIAVAMPTRQFVMIRRKDRYLTHAEVAFRDLVRGAAA